MKPAPSGPSVLLGFTGVAIIVPCEAVDGLTSQLVLCLGDCDLELSLAALMDDAVDAEQPVLIVDHDAPPTHEVLVCDDEPDCARKLAAAPPAASSVDAAAPPAAPAVDASVSGAADVSNVGHAPTPAVDASVSVAADVSNVGHMPTPAADASVSVAADVSNVGQEPTVTDVVDESQKTLSMLGDVDGHDADIEEDFTPHDDDMQAESALVLASAPAAEESLVLTAMPDISAYNLGDFASIDLGDMFHGFLGSLSIPMSQSSQTEVMHACDRKCRRAQALKQTMSSHIVAL
jgi:hypothetical protein